jgi:hypothetical protein
VPEPDIIAQAHIVHLILNKETEKALELLSAFYRIRAPDVRVGTVKGKRRTAYAVYVGNEARIYAMDSEIIYNPFVIMHEFYHHLRSQGGTHRGTEKHANAYAGKFIASYRQIVQRTANKPGS